MILRYCQPHQQALGLNVCGLHECVYVSGSMHSFKLWVMVAQGKENYTTVNDSNQV